ncbi:MAG: 50S ribosomal protein L18e [Candidatus Altiarchaeota archaeon]|nr:50S ribosomal protein L18e [Candidatus Altiarchaeota archaeon]
MPRSFGYEDPLRLELINELKAVARKEDAKIWSAVAKELSRPRRNREGVNIWRINKHSKKGETVVVPGKILSDGSLDHKVEVAAFKFTGDAKEKIETAGGKLMSISKLMKKNPKGSNIKLIK